MSTPATVTAVDQSSEPRSDADAWLVQGDCPVTGRLPRGLVAFYLARGKKDTVPPLAIGNTVTVPLNSDGGTVLTSDGRKLKKIGYADDPTVAMSPFPATGWRNPLTGVTQ